MLTVSCEEDLNINEDPLAATSADPKTVIPFVQVEYSARKVTELGTRITDVSQQISANFNSPRRGITSSFLTGNTWAIWYTNVLGNLQLLIQDAAAAGESQQNVQGISTIMKAMAFYELTSLWELVPFSQALDGINFPEPIFDSQEDILNGCVALLDEGINLLETAPTTGVVDLSSSELWYGGDYDSWIRYANTLKLRILFMIRNKDTSVDGEIANILNNEPLIETSAQNAYLDYAGGPGSSNAFHTIVTAFFGPSNEATYVHGPGPPLYDLLSGSGDPRFNLWIIDDVNGDPGIGFFPNPGFALLRNNVIRGDLPDVYATSAEPHFYRAEAILKGVAGVNGTAQASYEAGIQETLRWWGQEIPGATITITQGDIDTYIGTLNPVDLDAVYEQQYLETFLRPVVAWNTIRRNDHPQMDPVPGTIITTYLKRFNYPPDEVGSNPFTPANPTTDTPMWFEPI